MIQGRFLAPITLGLAVVGSFLVLAAPTRSFQFAILGDRQGGVVPGVYEQAWRETDQDHPAFVVSVGDSISGGDNSTCDAEWTQFLHLIAPYRKYPLFLVPGNHDVWSFASALAFEKYSRHPLHYSFDYEQAHFTVLDNSRSDSLPAAELAYLNADLEKHHSSPVKFILSHRPSWFLQALLANPNFPLHQLAKRFGVQYVLAGHIHQMLRYQIDGVTYLSLASSGGRLRDTREYRQGWFYQHTMVSVNGNAVSFAIKELAPPFGKSRVTQPSDWGPAGLVDPKSAN